MTLKPLHLATLLVIGTLTATVSADIVPPQAVAPVPPQERPQAQPQATGIVVEYDAPASRPTRPRPTPPGRPQSTAGNAAQPPAVPAQNTRPQPAASNTVQAQPATGNAVRPQQSASVTPQAEIITDFSEQIQREIYAMLADEVKNVDNVVMIEHQIVGADTEPAVDSSMLSVADQPNGHFRVFAQLKPKLEDGKAILNLQLLRAGHSGDANDMVKPISETVIRIKPDNVRASQGDIHDFLAANLHMSDGQAQQAMDRPQMALWIEANNADGSQDVKEGSKLVVYYKPDADVYVNLYYLNESDEIQRLIPGKIQPDNFAKAGQIYRFPPRGDGLVISGSGTDKIRAIYTRLPSGVGKDMGLDSNIAAKQAPIGVIPTQYPAIFATQDLSRFFSLPEAVWNEYEIAYTIKK